MTSDEELFFEGSATGLAIYRAVEAAVSSIGPAEVRVGRSEIAFRHGRGFAFVWRPDRYLTSDVPAVLSIGLPVELRSPRFKQVLQVSPRVWMHHLELRAVDDVDQEVGQWLSSAYDAAG